MYGVLFRRNFDNILLRFLEREESQKVISSLHEGPVGGHFGAEVTAHKILKEIYYWATLFRDVYSHVRKCVECQKLVEKEKRLAFPLQPVSVETPFQQWGLDVIGEINPSLSSQHKYIITTTDYCTKWSMATTLRKINGNLSFPTENIITRFAFANSIICDNAKYFSFAKLTEFALEFGIKFKYSANYYLQGNGLVESTNKNLINIIKRTISQNPHCWHDKLPLAL